MISVEYCTKILGALLLLISSLCFGNSMIKGEAEKINESLAIAELIKYVRDNIEHFVKPLPDIFLSYKNELLEKNGFLTFVRKNGIQKSAEKIDDFFHCDRDVISIFRKFCSDIGGGYRDEEIRLCSFSLSQLERKIEKIKNDHLSKVKMYRTIPPLFALSVVLILV